MSGGDPGTVRFSVLGPVRAWRDGAELDLGPPQRRATLAVLLVRARRPVGLAEISDVLWGQEPPVSAANVIHRHIGILRRLLEPGLPNRAEGERLVRVDGGYRLRVAADDIDLLRFRGLRDQAREADRQGLRAEAVDRWNDALLLWRGPVAAGIPADVRAHRFFTALEREYLTAAREAADIALRHGLADRVLTSLEQCAARHPLDQQVQARLALALAATGHQAEALETCRIARVRLAGALGILPGPELRAAQQKVLEGNSTGQAPSTPAPVPSRHVGVDAPPRPRRAVAGEPVGLRPDPPRQLPAPPPALTGRRAEADQLSALADEAGPGRGTPFVGAVCGPAGIGKTALALHLAHRLADRYPDGQLHVDLRGFDPSRPPVAPAEAVIRLLAALGVPAHRVPEDLDNRAALYRSLLSRRRVLLLLDDARDAEQVRPLLPGGPGCLVLVTSRNRLSGLVAAEGARRVTLEPLASQQAAELLADRLGAERPAAEAEAYRRIVAACAGRPSVLVAAAAAATADANTTLATVAARLECHEVAEYARSVGTAGSSGSSRTSDPLRPTALVESATFAKPIGCAGPVGRTEPAASAGSAGHAGSPGNNELARSDSSSGFGPIADLCRALSASYRTLTPAAARLFRLLALHPGPDVGTAAVSALAGVELRQGRALLSELADLHLVAERVPGRFALGAVERLYATMLLHEVDAAHTRGTAVRRLLGHVLHMARAATRLLTPVPHDRPEPDGAAGGEPDGAGFPNAEAARAWFAAELPTLPETVRLAAHAAATSDGVSDDTVDAWRFLTILEPLFEPGGHDQAWMAVAGTALAAARRAADLPGQARSQLSLGRVYGRLGRAEEAVAALEEALRLFAPADDGPGRALAHLALAAVHGREGRHESSARHARSAVELARAIGDRRAEASALTALGRARARLGHLGEGLAHCRGSAALHRQLGDRYGEARAWEGVGDVQHLLGFPEQAAACYEQAVSLLNEHPAEGGHPAADAIRGKLRGPVRETGHASDSGGVRGRDPARTGRAPRSARSAGLISLI
ncbi:BTAD domain-containing putative transcriptional regulator [Streptomyces sp. NPDC048324]|uniref:AfsR/SARP family transcriptional regulator n=1 Tax=Streptomyces sp. NPDC048324 TaxID=3157205 RepID=UPI00342A6170